MPAVFILDKPGDIRLKCVVGESFSLSTSEKKSRVNRFATKGERSIEEQPRHLEEPESHMYLSN